MTRVTAPSSTGRTVGHVPPDVTPRMSAPQRVSGANAVKTREAPNFGARACLKTYVMPNAGHSAALHVKAPELFNYVHAWLDNYTVNYVTAKDANGCLLWIP